jgi:hypothetical protein
MALWGEGVKVGGFSNPTKNRLNYYTEAASYFLTLIY